MGSDSVTRRAALKYAGIIAIAAARWPTLSAYSTPSPGKGYGTDPDLLKRPVTWRRTLNQSQLKSFSALCEIILPGEPPHASAAAIGVQNFIDEWVSAPYAQMRADRATLLKGLTSLNGVTRDEYGKAFDAGTLAEQTAAFGKICTLRETRGFARRLVELVCAGYYTTREGHGAIGYVGNVALSSFPPPTPEVIRHLQDALDRLPSARRA